MGTRQLSFAEAPESDGTSVTYSLLTLPPYIVKLIAEKDEETATFNTGAKLEIRGNATDSAVLVTSDKTYALRGVQNSNSLCLCSSTAPLNPTRDWFTASRPSGEDLSNGYASDEGDEGDERTGDTIEIETVLHETLQLVPSVARTERLESLLRGTDYTGDDTECFNRLSFNDLRSELPASDAEIMSALRTHRAIRLASVMRGEAVDDNDEDDRSGVNDDSEIRRLPIRYLLKLLPAILGALEHTRVPRPDPAAAALALKAKQREKEEALKQALRYGKKTKGTTASTAQEEPEMALLELEFALDDVYSAVEAAADCGRQAADAILTWFEASSSSNRGVIRVHDIVREIGLSALEEGGHTAQRLDAFMAKWKSLVGEFENLCNLPLLAGNHIVQMTPHPSTITYLSPTRLSPDPATRFSELFSLKPRWKDTDMLQFLGADELAGGDIKKRDATVLKFVRKVKEKDGSTTWTARNLW